ncbi:MAG: hypothetical protein JWR00_2563, partial [Rubritepida sp.]|nr:hypothetical protein [Rubritepida sp.]
SHQLERCWFMRNVIETLAVQVA